MQTTGNTILITGGGSGIGRGLAESFHKLGNTVIIAGRRKAVLEEVCAAHPGMQFRVADVSTPEGADALAAEIARDFPNLNVLINNAGVAKPENLNTDAPDTELIKSTIYTNVVGVLHLTLGLLPTLKKQAQSVLMVTTSGLAFVPYAPGPTYGATKAFLHSWWEALRYQLRETSVEVLELVPPYVQTELGGERQKSDPRAMPLDEYITEVMSLLPDAHKEINVERVKPLRYAEKNGNYDQLFNAIAGMHD